MYLEGDFVEQNDEKAFFWIEKSADQNNRDALLILSQMHRDGIGTKKNTKLAQQYMNKLKH
jgi:TPR repeat protein